MWSTQVGDPLGHREEGFVHCVSWQRLVGGTLSSTENIGFSRHKQVPHFRWLMNLAKSNGYLINIESAELESATKFGRIVSFLFLWFRLPRPIQPRHEWFGQGEKTYRSSSIDKR